jgi:inner membrane protein
MSSGGLGRRTRLGPTALIVGANLPDLDVLAYFAGPLADLEWRRGWTHGVLALVLLPVLLTGGLMLLARIRRPPRSGGAFPVRPRQLLLLSSIAIVSHPLLDTLNTYGVRWLMPFSGEWYYGDVLFIVDPWVWLALAAGVAWAWRRRRISRARPVTPARLALALVLGYIVIMGLSSAVARNVIIRDVQSRYGGMVHAAMAGPLPLTPLKRSFVVVQDEQYRVGTFSWLRRPQVDLAKVESFPRRRPSHPALAQAESTEVFQRFLGWARFPTFSVDETTEGGYRVHAVDLRYARAPGDGFGTLTVHVPGK